MSQVSLDSRLMQKDVNESSGFVVTVSALDWWLLASVAALLYVGLVIIMSASIDVADARSGNPFMYASRHGIFYV